MVAHLLSFLTVRALPKLSRMGLLCSTWLAMEGCVWPSSRDRAASRLPVDITARYCIMCFVDSVLPVGPSGGVLPRVTGGVYMLHAHGSGA
jgi:hypothetical protein